MRIAELRIPEDREEKENSRGSRLWRQEKRARRERYWNLRNGPQAEMVRNMK